MIKIRVYDPDKYYDNDKGRNITINIAPGYTCLVGPNGVGKSTMLEQIRDILRQEKDSETGLHKYEVVYYDNLHDGGSKQFGMWMMNGMFEKIAAITSSSEGEGIIYNITEFAMQCGVATKKCIEKNRTLIILIDGLDSGTSIDKIYKFKSEFIDTIIDHCSQSNVEAYIIATANNYAMIDDEIVDCIFAKNGKHMKFKTYNSFRKFILKNAKETES